MSDMVIRVEGLGKKYIIGHQQERERYVALRDVIARGTRSLVRAVNPWKRHQQAPSPEREEFWALKDVSFEVKRGDRVAIIGRNGAGKSTLLKILSRITEPTEGRVHIRGRVASLLEVGTGFHPELTGRENIYLNGAILGMSKGEIRRKFDEIVAFAEVERFLDTPVKRYSSGMYVRLAFAVAAHLEPEILVVDEVLAVGDAQFQKKCLGKMEDVAEKEGRTVLFVSHNMAAVQTLCEVGILIDKGILLKKGDVKNIINKYMTYDVQVSKQAQIQFPKPSHALLWIESITLLVNREAGTILTTGDCLSFKIFYCSREKIQDPKVGFVIYSSEGYALLNGNNHYQTNVTSLSEPELSGIITCHLGKVPLIEGIYFISFWLGDIVQNHHYLEHALSFEVIDRDIWGTAKTPPKVSSLWWPTQFEVRSFQKVGSYSSSKYNSSD